MAAYDAHLVPALDDASGSLSVWLGRPKFDPGQLVELDRLAFPGIDPPPAGSGRINALRRIVKHLRNWSRVLAAARRGSIDVAHFQWLPVLEPVPLDAWLVDRLRRHGVRVVYTAHNVLPHNPTRRSRAVYADLYRRLDEIIVHTRTGAERLVDEFGVPDSRLHVIPHGLLDADRIVPSRAKARAELDLPRDVPLFLMFGNLAGYKGADLAIRAFHGLLERVDGSAHLVLAGRINTDQRLYLQRIIGDLGIPSTSLTTAFGHVPDRLLSTYYGAADLVLFPYRSITQSGALLTAIAMRKPFLASPLPAFRETLSGRAADMIVPSLDPDDWARAMARAVERQDDFEGMAASLREEIAETASWSSIARRTVRVYREALQD